MSQFKYSYETEAQFEARKAQDAAEMKAIADRKSAFYSEMRAVMEKYGAEFDVRVSARDYYTSVDGIDISIKQFEFQREGEWCCVFPKEDEFSTNITAEDMATVIFK
jgi:alpha-D-ribose 1-methylphosphonate 5-phosphate C-P lyase